MCVCVCVFVCVCVCVCVCVSSVETAVLRIIKGLNTPEFLIQLAKQCATDPKVVGPRTQHKACDIQAVVVSSSIT